MFATIVIDWNQRRTRSSFFHTKAEAIEYAERMPGVIEVEEIGGGVIWTRKEEEA